MKDIKTLFAGESTYQRTPTEEEKYDSEYAKWVDLTAKLIGRSYIQTHALVKNWPLNKIQRRYKEAMDCNKELTKPVIRWWSLRKQDKKTKNRNDKNLGNVPLKTDIQSPLKS